MGNGYITAGEFAKLAHTTKRTVLWYDKKGIICPYFVNADGYRYYQPRQIIDFQAVLLLRQFGFTLQEIKDNLNNGQSLSGLFNRKQKEIVDHINSMKLLLEQTKEYYRSLSTSDTFITPKVTEERAKVIYSMQCNGPYSKIGDYLIDFKKMFRSMPKNAVFIVGYQESGFKPIKSKFKVGVIVQKSMKLVIRNTVKMETIPDFRSLSYTHNGSSDLLSFIWKELDKYRAEKKFKLNDQLGYTCFEVYKNKSKTVLNLIIN